MPRFFCHGCGKPKGYCYCERVVPEYNQANILILRHPKEAKHALGTAGIVQQSLQRCHLLDVPRVDESLVVCKHLHKRNTFLVFPTKHSQPLAVVDDLLVGQNTAEGDCSVTGEHTMRAATFVFLDATWRKAKRMYFESKTLQALPAVYLPDTEKSRYILRQSRLKHSLSTLEAVVSTLRVVEQSPKAYQSLLDTMDWMIQRQVDSMGAVTFRKHYSR